MYKCGVGVEHETIRVSHGCALFCNYRRNKPNSVKCMSFDVRVCALCRREMVEWTSLHIFLVRVYRWNTKARWDYGFNTRNGTRGYQLTAGPVANRPDNWNCQWLGLRSLKFTQSIWLQISPTHACNTETTIHSPAFKFEDIISIFRSEAGAQTKNGCNTCLSMTNYSHESNMVNK